MEKQGKLTMENGAKSRAIKQGQAIQISQKKRGR